jgi:tryptophan-rich sensory protein
MTKSSYKMNNLLPLAIALWSLQLALNVIWTPIFSGAQNLEVAFYYIIMLWVIIIAYIFVCWRIDRLASLMMMPYLAWVSFASVLNYYYWQLN